MPSPLAAFTRLSPSTTALLLCDMQEKCRNNISYFPQIVEVSRRLYEAAKLLDMKVIATEHSTPELRHTVVELGLDGSNVPIVEKTKFSMIVPEVEKLLGSEIKAVILCGVESHVCVLQTVRDLLAKGIAVHVVADAASSRSMVDRMYAFKQMDKAGAILTTSECVILGLIDDSTHPKYDEIQNLVSTPAPDSGLLTGRDKADL